jgi:hypothetical protein
MEATAKPEKVEKMATEAEGHSTTDSQRHVVHLADYGHLQLCHGRAEAD